MAGLAIAILFILMVAAPCLVALRNSRELGDIDEFVPEDFEAEEFVPEEIAPEKFLDEVPVPIAVHEPLPDVRPSGLRANAQSLREAAVAAEVEAVMAKDRADRAHWEALTAAARAAALRADAAAEAAQAAILAADRAMWAADNEFSYEDEYSPEESDSVQIPRDSARGRRAA